MFRVLYNAWYKWGTPPWVSGPRSELVKYIEEGKLKSGKAIDLGCGVGDNAIFLAEHGYQVTGVDFAEAAIEQGQASAKKKGLKVDFIVGDLTDLSNIKGPFDLVIDYGTYDDLSQSDRRKYEANLIRLTKKGSQFFIWCFEWDEHPFLHFLRKFLPIPRYTLVPGEMEAVFSENFRVEQLGSTRQNKGFPKGWAYYLMTRK